MDWTPKDIIEALQEISKLIFGGPIPPVVAAFFGWALFIVLILGVIWLLLFLVSKIIEVSKEKIWPNFYDLDEKRRNLRRRRFAEHIDNEIRFLNRQEAWSDYRFAELEAEVEAEGQRRLFPYIPFVKRTQTGLRREKSLSLALEKSEDRLILLEGEPGAGKSVALRHLTTLLAQRASKSPNNKTVIPIYVNLKELRRAGEHIDRPQIYNFVLKSLNRVNDRDVEEFLEAEFDKGMQAGTWLFLFDSFDEIPDVLSSTEADATIREYANAISDFLHGMNQCRGVIASRQFRGPGAMGWPKFKVLQLSEKRQLELIKNSGMEPEKENIFSGMLGVASHEIRSMSSNPMFLGLVCDHYKMGNAFPENPHGVFETYINSRFTHDEERIERRFGLGIQHLRALAENIAFCMAADAGLGLSPTRDAIKDALERLKFKYTDLEKTLDALEFMKIARSDVSSPGESKSFTFAHRRFQEYFATSVVLRAPERVSARELLLNARWRETAVVVCQTQSDAQLNPIYENVSNMLDEMVASLRLSFPDIDHVGDDLIISKALLKEGPNIKPFVWPKRSLHLLGLLQSGFGNQLSKLPKDIRKEASKIVISGYKKGILLDKKWALEVAGCIPSQHLVYLIAQAFKSWSEFLHEAAYRQISYLEDIPDLVGRSIRLALIGLLVNGRLEQEKNSTYAHLRRLAKPEHFLAAFRFLRMIRLGDYLLLSALFILGIWWSYSQPSFVNLWWFFTLGFVIILWGAHITLYGYRTLNLGVLSSISSPVSIVIFFTFFRSLISLSVLCFLGIITYFFGSIGNIVDFIQLLFLLGIFSLLCLLWAPFSLAAIETGQFMNPTWWPTMILFPIYYLFVEIKSKNIKKVLDIFKFHPLFIVLVPIAIITYSINKWIEVVGFKFSVIVGVASMLIVFFVYQKNYLFALLSILMLVGYPPMLLFYRWARDEYIIKKLTREKTQLSTQNFIDYCVGGFYESSTREKFVRNIRKMGLLKTTFEDIELLKWFCLFIENYSPRLRRARNLLWAINNHNGNILFFIVFARYLMNIFREKKLNSLLSKKISRTNLKMPVEYSSKFIDEIHLLLEQASAISEEKE